MMSRLPGCLFKFTQKEPPELRGVHSTGVATYLRKKTEKLFLEISHKIHKESTCVLESLFQNLLKKET